MKELLRKRIGLIIFGAMLLSFCLNFAMQTYMARNNMAIETRNLFQQISNVLKSNAREEDILKQDFQDKCLSKAILAANYLQQNQQFIYDVNELRRYSLMLDVDELHIFNTEGKIISGTLPKYYGMTLNDGLQMSYFLPMLQDKTLHMYQDIFPNTAEKKMMIYAAVWTDDGKNIIQVGMHPKRYLDVVERNNISAVFRNILVDETTTIIAIDDESWKIVGSTNDKLIDKKFTDIGFEANDIIDGRIGVLRTIENVGSYAVFSSDKVESNIILCRFVNNKDLYKNAVYNSLMLLVYLIILALIIMYLTSVFLRKEIVDSIDNINDNLSKITNGNLDVRLNVRNLPEFAHLTQNINGMVDSLLDVPNKMFAMCSKANLPLGLYEYYASMERVVATKNIGRLLHISETELEHLMTDQKLFEAKLDDIRSFLVNAERHIYKIPWAEAYVRLEFVEYKKGVMGIIVDKTSDYLEKVALEHERDCDAMTGLFTRRKFYREMQKLLAAPKKVGKAALIFVDANGLKYINDNFGHDAGDSYLCRIADILMLNAQGENFACRFGGDEFILFMYGFEDRVALQAAVQIIDKQIEQNTMLINNKQISVSGSMGAAVYGDDGCSISELIKIADARMYENKMLYHKKTARS